MWHKPVGGTCEEYIAAYPLKTRIVKLEKTAITREQHGKNT
jgi:hypothetical protein